MAAVGRNFRSSYYERVGCYSVEENKSLKTLLSDDVRNHSKLKQFCLSWTIPGKMRSELWQLVLGILPVHRASTDFIWEQRRAVFEDLLSAVKCLKYVDSNTPKNRALFYMWLCEKNRILHPASGGSENDAHFNQIVLVLMQIFETDVEIYWIAKEFFANCIKDIRQENPKLKEMTQTLLKREDIVLFNHLDNLDIFDNKDCLENWYATGFAGIISEPILVKIWDKICGGSTKIVIFVFLELVKTLRERFLACKSISDIRTLLETGREQDAIIVNKAIKAWQSNKNHNEITVH